MLDVSRLVTFRAVVRSGSFTAAAQALHLTQPAVSRQVSLLERRLGTLLVHRTKRGVRATEAGRALLAHADAVVAQLERAESEVRQFGAAQRGTVRLGCFLSALVHVSAELGALLDAHAPGLRIVDELADRTTALARLRSGDLDLAVVFEHDFEPAPPEDVVDLVDLFDDPLEVLLPAAHPLAARPSVAVAELAGETWIRAHDGSAARRTDVVLARAGLRPAVLLAGRGDEPFEAQALVAAGRGIALTHRLGVVVSDHQLAARPLSDEPGRRRVQAAVLAGPRTPATEIALQALRDVGAARRR